MSSLTVSTTIARSPADVYELLDDLANHEQFIDHFLVDWHMTREDTRGVGAGVRLRTTLGSHRDAEITVIESSPSRIVETTSGGSCTLRDSRLACSSRASSTSSSRSGSA